MQEMKYLFKQLYAAARSNWRDMKDSGLDRVERSKRRAFEVAAQQTGFPTDLCSRLYNRCFQEFWSFDLCAWVDPLDPNARMYELSDHISGSLEVRQYQAADREGMACQVFTVLDTCTDSLYIEPSFAKAVVVADMVGAELIVAADADDYFRALRRFSKQQGRWIEEPN